ncbi:MAG: amino acid-binding protein [Thermoprotei archaeon]|nr:MAG: amino acid-binding protein [Thermoprotei archaeon]
MSNPRLWDIINSKFGRAEKKMKVVKAFLKYGFKLKREKDRIFIYLDKVKISYSALANALGVDRRVVVETVKNLAEDEFLRNFFENLEPAGASLRGVSRLLGYRCIIVETYEDKPGILASVAVALAKRNINILQVIADDPNIIENPKLYIIVSGDVPGDVVNEILENKVIKNITIS